MADSKVPFTMQVQEKCLCKSCPIQGESKCVMDKKQKMMEMMKMPMPAGMMPKPEDVPGVYCGSGKATCTDLDFSKMCICAGCPTWTEYKLMQGKPMGYFCRDGKAE